MSEKRPGLNAHQQAFHRAAQIRPMTSIPATPEPDHFCAACWNQHQLKVQHTDAARSTPAVAETLDDLIAGARAKVKTAIGRAKNARPADPLLIGILDGIRDALDTAARLSEAPANPETPE